ncbi:MAG: hypothetical protein ABW043_18555 [Devosia sp.]|uniref:hypothetical protein n=1 Tax=Devosia sp. TaxID=1871048 RepID=UPI003396B468
MPRHPASHDLILDPPMGGAAIRMYRIGHGDCFLLSFLGQEGKVFVLIDCGYKPGSEKCLPIKTSADDVVADIRRVTDGKLNVVVVTHEHQDHLNGFTEERFKGFEIGHLWFSWVESESDQLANALRRRHEGQLRGLSAARSRLAANGSPTAARIDEMVALEIGGEQEGLTTEELCAAGRFTNKSALAMLRSKIQGLPRCIYPHQEIVRVPGVDFVRVFALGPPHDENAIADLEPRGGEAFPRTFSDSLPDMSFEAALGGRETFAPFAGRYATRLDRVGESEELSSWYDRHYGRGEESNDDDDVVSGNAKFRRIEHDWLHSADRMAMAMGEFTNNSSLVLAFELGKGGKVLLFAGDAQRGNWASWAAKDFPDSEGDVNVRELLGRTVLYKVGHHGSHNATLQGRTQDDYPNLAWLGRNRHAEEFAAMVPAVRKWAIETAGWDHPLPSISQALKVKCGERVIQTDTDLAHNAEGTHAMIDFMSRTRSTPLYFDYVVMPD